MSGLLVYLLAAGRGRRAGGPKAWRPHEGRTLLERQLDFLLALFPPNAVVVSVQEAWLDRCRELHPLVQWVPVDPDASPLASLQALLRTAPLSGWAYLYHVDMPVWDAALFDRLASERRDEAVIPTHGGRGGHPILLSADLYDQLAALDPARDRLDVFLRGRRVHRVEVPQACVLENWNGWGSDPDFDYFD